MLQHSVSQSGVHSIFATVAKLAPIGFPQSGIDGPQLHGQSFNSARKTSGLGDAALRYQIWASSQKIDRVGSNVGSWPQRAALVGIPFGHAIHLGANCEIRTGWRSTISKQRSTITLPLFQLNIQHVWRRTGILMVQNCGVGLAFSPGPADLRLLGRMCPWS